MTGPVPLRSGRAGRSLVLVLTASLAVTSLGGCGSSGKHAAAHPARSVVISDPSTVVSVTVAVGDTIDFRIPPLTGEHRSNGQPVTWPAPYASQTSVLQPEAVPDCPSDYTCEAFEARSVGTAILYSPSPSGIICGDGHGCAGVAAPLPRRIPVDVRDEGAPVVIYRR